MNKIRIGSIGDKVLIKGDENYIKPHEILVTKDPNFKLVFKEKVDGKIKTTVALDANVYIAKLEEAHDAGYDEGFADGQETADTTEPPTEPDTTETTSSL